MRNVFFYRGLGSNGSVYHLSESATSQEKEHQERPAPSAQPLFFLIVFKAVFGRVCTLEYPGNLPGYMTYPGRRYTQIPPPRCLTTRNVNLNRSIERLLRIPGYIVRVVHVFHFDRKYRTRKILSSVVATEATG